MRILLLGSHMHYNLEHYVYMNLFKLGHEVKFYGYKERLGRLANSIRMAITRSKLAKDIANLFWLNRINEEIKKLAGEFYPDLVLSIKGEAIKPKTVEYINKELSARTALWYPDDPRFFRSLVRYIAPVYDYVFTCSSNAIPMYKELGIKHVYRIAFACEPTVHKKESLDHQKSKRFETDVIFIGTYTPSKARIIKTLVKAGVKVDLYGPYWKYFMRGNNTHNGVYGIEMVRLLNASRIALNFHANSNYGPNMRVFEVTGSGAFLLTDKGEDLEKFFDINKEVVVFSDEKELALLVRYFLLNEEERANIADTGYSRCHAEHTYEKRLRDMLKVIR